MKQLYLILIILILCGCTEKSETWIFDDKSEKCKTCNEIKITPTKIEYKNVQINDLTGYDTIYYLKFDIIDKEEMYEGCFFYILKEKGLDNYTFMAHRNNVGKSKTQSTFGAPEHESDFSYAEVMEIKEFYSENIKGQHGVKEFYTDGYYFDKK